MNIWDEYQHEGRCPQCGAPYLEHRTLAQDTHALPANVDPEVVTRLLPCGHAIQLTLDVNHELVTLLPSTDQRSHLTEH